MYTIAPVQPARWCTTGSSRTNATWHHALSTNHWNVQHWLSYLHCSTTVENRNHISFPHGNAVFVLMRMWCSLHSALQCHWNYPLTWSTMTEVFRRKSNSRVDKRVKRLEEKESPSYLQMIFFPFKHKKDLLPCKFILLCVQYYAQILCTERCAVHWFSLLYNKIITETCKAKVIITEHTQKKTNKMRLDAIWKTNKNDTQEKHSLQEQNCTWQTNIKTRYTNIFLCF